LNFGLVLDQWERGDQPLIERSIALSDIISPISIRYT